MEVTGNTVLITGGTSGIGLEFARQLLSLRNDVIVTGRDEGKLRAVLSANPDLHGIVSDASDIASIAQLHQRVIHEYPATNMLINNAGIMRVVRLADERSCEDVTREIDIDLSGPIRMIQAFLSHLQSKSSAAIVNVTSGLAFVPFPISPIYSAAKAGLHAYSRCLRAQLKNSRVTVIELAPPLTDTPLFTTEYRAMMRGATPMPVDLLVKKAITEISHGKLEVRLGQSRALHLASRIAPNFIFRQMSKVGL